MNEKNKKLLKEKERLEHLIGCMNNSGKLLDKIERNFCTFQLNNFKKPIKIEYNLGDKNKYDEIIARVEYSNEILFSYNPSKLSEISCFATKGIPIIKKKLNQLY